MPRSLYKAQQRAERHGPDAEAAVRERMRHKISKTTAALVRALHVHSPMALQSSIIILAGSFVCSLIRQRITTKQFKLDKMKTAIAEKPRMCCSCSMMPPEGKLWLRKSKFCRVGRLCDECQNGGYDEPHTHNNTEPEVDKWEAQRRINRYENRLIAFSLAVRSIVGACAFIECERHNFRFRHKEICEALHNSLKKETLKKWVARIRTQMKILPPGYAERVHGFACRLVLSCAPHDDPRAREMELGDLRIMIHGVLRADSKKKDKVANARKTVQEVDGQLQMCLLNGRLKTPVSPEITTGKPLEGRSERLVAAVLVYLRLRLRGREMRTTIMDHKALAGVDLQSFQACKSRLVQLIEPGLWA